MSNLLPFQFRSHQIRVIQKDGEPWFVLADVCKILELENPSKVKLRLDPDDVQVIDLSTLSSIQGNEIKDLVNVVNESGLYDVVLRSDKPEARPFRKWVTSEVLPSIRKTGSYNLTPKASASQFYLPGTQLVIDWLNASEALGLPKSFALQLAGSEATRTTGLAYDKLVSASPYMNDVKDNEVWLEPTEIGAKLDMSAVSLNRLLADLGYQIKVNGEWRPTEKAEGMAQRHAWSRGGKSGYNLKWNMEAVREALDEI